MTIEDCEFFNSTMNTATFANNIMTGTTFTCDLSDVENVSIHSGKMCSFHSQLDTMRLYLNMYVRFHRCELQNVLMSAGRPEDNKKIVELEMELYIQYTG